MICTFYGSVVGGKHFGNTLGFPTANVVPEGEVALPQNGVYAAEMTLLSTGEKLHCVLNQGKHPTFPEGAPTIEAFILDFSRDIYGQQVQVTYVEFLRSEKKFPSVEEIRAQIARDVERARQILGA